MGLSAGTLRVLVQGTRGLQSAAKRGPPSCARHCLLGKLLVGLCADTLTALVQGLGGPLGGDRACGGPPAAPTAACLASLLAGLFAERRQLRAALAELDAFCRQGGEPRSSALGSPPAL